MNYLKVILICVMLYAGIEDMFFMSINSITWIIIHILLFIVNWKLLLLLPFYYILQKISSIGLADWVIIACAITISNNYYLCFIIAYLLLCATINIKEKKVAMILPVTVGIILSTEFVTISL